MHSDFHSAARHDCCGNLLHDLLFWVTIRRSNQLNYAPALKSIPYDYRVFLWLPVRSSNFLKMPLHLERSLLDRSHKAVSPESIQPQGLSSSSALPAVLFSESGFGGAATARSMALNKRPSASKMCSAVSPTDQRSCPGFQFHCASLTFST